MNAHGGPVGDTVDTSWTPSTRAARGGAPNRVWGGHGWRNKVDGHLPRAALSGACVFPALERVVLPSNGCKSAGLGQYMQYIHIQFRYSHTYLYIQYIHDMCRYRHIKAHTCTYIRIHTHIHSVKTGLGGGFSCGQRLRMTPWRCANQPDQLG